MALSSSLFCYYRFTEGTGHAVQWRDLGVAGSQTMQGPKAFVPHTQARPVKPGRWKETPR